MFSEYIWSLVPNVTLIIIIIIVIIIIRLEVKHHLFFGTYIYIYTYISYRK